MSGVSAKVDGVWIDAASGPSGFGTFFWIKRAGVWVLAFGGQNADISVWVKIAGVWANESIA